MNHNPIFNSLDDQKLLLSTLRMLGVTHVQVGFSGSGDSGNIDEVIATNAQDHYVDLTSTSLTWTRVHGESTWDGTKLVWERKTDVQVMSVEKILKDMCNTALDHTQLDWYNNDGGQGYFSIDVTQDVPRITLEVGINETVTHDHTFDYYEPMTEEEANAPMSSQPVVS